MRHLTGPACGLAAWAAWNLLGPAWAYTALAAAVVWLAAWLPAAMAAASEKAKSTETRVNALVPAVHDAKTAAAAASTAAGNAQDTADNALPKSGGYITGDLHISGWLYGTGGVLTIGDSCAMRGGSVTVYGGGGLWIGGGGDACLTESKTAFLTGLSTFTRPGGVSLDPWSGSAWANGERADYINDLRSKWNVLCQGLINSGLTP